MCGFFTFLCETRVMASRRLMAGRECDTRLSDYLVAIPRDCAYPTKRAGMFDFNRLCGR